MITAKGEIDPKQPFDLKRTLKCAQGHRWRPVDDIEWSTVFNDYVVRIRQKCRDAPLSYESKKDKATVEAKLRWQFRLQRDDENVEKVYAKLEKDAGTGKDDPHMKQLVNDYRGLRVMRVDPWECLVFFILSTKTNIFTTQKRMEAIADRLGNSVPPDVVQRHTFPTYTDIDHRRGKALSKLMDLKLGLAKDAKIYAAAALVEYGRPSLNGLHPMPVEEAIKHLQQLWGVGPKVSNCTALFSLEQMNAFPVDTNVESGLKSRYKDPKFKLPKTTDAMMNWGRKFFCPYAGYASQLLFADNYSETKRQ